MSRGTTKDLERHWGKGRWAGGAPVWQARRLVLGKPGERACPWRSRSARDQADGMASRRLRGSLHKKCPLSRQSAC